jgi:putative ABC transport system substrate-binding protein
LALLVSGCGEKKPKVYRVGIVGGGAFTAIGEGFKSKMTELGYIEGENIVYDWPDSDPDVPAMHEVVKQFVEDEVDLIFTSGSTPAALAAKAATQDTDIPVVFAYAATEGTDLINSVREPGGNLTGVRYPGHEMIAKRLELMVELAPETKRVWIGYDKNNPNTDASLAALRPAAESLGVTLVEVPAETQEEIDADLAARGELDDPGMDAIILMADGFNSGEEALTMLLRYAAAYKVPLGGSLLSTVQQGAIFGNANDVFKVGELAAPLADKIFRGTPAGTIPVVTPEQYLWINYQVAQELGLSVPEGLLSMATEVIR